jgi:dolichol-phosphate mannosyltransferase
MYKSRKIFLITAAYNEEGKIGEVVRRVPRDIVDDVFVVDDGSTDGTANEARRYGAEVRSLDRVYGAGFAVRLGLAEAQHRGMDIAVVIAGNNKDAPEEIAGLLDPICDENCDFVVGSRFLEGGGYGGDMPLYRKVATRLHPVLVSLFCRKWVSETSNGYRAINVSVLADPRIDLHQAWLDGYQLEVYLLMKVLKLGYHTTEVPVTKIYPHRSKGNTKMRPFVDWWHMLSPVFAVGLGLDRLLTGGFRTKTWYHPIFNPKRRTEIT